MLLKSGFRYVTAYLIFPLGCLFSVSHLTCPKLNQWLLPNGYLPQFSTVGDNSVLPIAQAINLKVGLDSSYSLLPHIQSNHQQNLSALSKYVSRVSGLLITSTITTLSKLPSPLTWVTGKTAGFLSLFLCFGPCPLSSSSQPAAKPFPTTEAGVILLKIMPIKSTLLLRKVLIKDPSHDFPPQ